MNCSWGSFESHKIDAPMQQLCCSHFSWSVLWLDPCLWFFFFFLFHFFSCWLYLQSFSKIGGYFTFVFLLKGFSLVWACRLCTSPILWLVPLSYSVLLLTHGLFLQSLLQSSTSMSSLLSLSLSPFLLLLSLRLYSSQRTPSAVFWISACFIMCCYWVSLEWITNQLYHYPKFPLRSQ